MPYFTFGQVQRRATAVGLVMSRKGVDIHLRYRDPESGDESWSGLDARQASHIIDMIAANSRNDV